VKRLRRIAGLIGKGLERLTRTELVTLSIGPVVFPPVAITPAELPVIAPMALVEPPGLTRLYEILREL